MATMPVIASSFSPERGQRLDQRAGDDPGDDRGEQAEQRAEHHRPPQAAAHADERGGDGGEDQHRLEALAEDEDRRVGHHGGAARAVAQRRRRVGQLLVEHEPRLAQLAPRGPVGDQRRQAGLLRRAEPDRALDVERQPGIERLQAPLGAELEERVRLQPCLLGLAVLAGAGRRLHAVERQGDQVVVGLVGALLPRLGHRRVQRVLDPRGLGLDLVRRRAPPRAARPRRPRGGRAGRCRLPPCRCARRRAWRAGRAGRRRPRRRRCGRRPPPGSRSRASRGRRRRRGRTRPARARGNAAAAARAGPPRRA